MGRGIQGMGNGTWDMGEDARTLTCCPDLHWTSAHLCQPLQADAIFHRPGDRAVPGGGEAAELARGSQGFNSINLLAFACKHLGFSHELWVLQGSVLPNGDFVRNVSTQRKFSS